jgi:hypothetical protein
MFALMCGMHMSAERVDGRAVHPTGVGSPPLDE